MATQPGYPKAVEALVTQFRRLPGIGRRTAERLALALLDWPREDLARFGTDIATLRDQVRFCEQCGNLSDGPQCSICASAQRAQDQICVVEQATQIQIIERSGCYRGLYHVLGGRLAPLEGKGPESLRMAELARRLDSGTVRELIVATSPDVEGEATANYLAAEFASRPVRITRIATGVPAGADLSYADSATLAMAISGRHPLR